VSGARGTVADWSLRSLANGRTGYAAVVVYRAFFDAVFRSMDPEKAR
jgi:hypothetical protein